MLIDVRFVVGHLLAVAGLALFIIAAKIVATLAGLAPFHLGSKTMLFTSLGMIQFGEFSYVLARVGQDSGSISPGVNALLLAVSVVTILLTPAAFWLAPRADRNLTRLPFLRRWLGGQPRVWAAEEALREHVIVAGYGRVGQLVAESLRGMGVTIVVIEDDLMVAQSLRAQDFPVIFGDASNDRILGAARLAEARALIACLPDSGATRAVVAYARRLRPDLDILARISRPEDAELLKRYGVRSVLPEHAGARQMLELSEQTMGLPISAETEEESGAWRS
jgi:CPA2 family monovalent cation:H+ antiporter-2